MLCKISYELFLSWRKVIGLFHKQYLSQPKQCIHHHSQYLSCSFIGQLACIISDGIPCLFSLFFLSFSFCYTSWFHHHVSRLPAVLTFLDVSPSSFLEMLRIISTILCQSSCPLSIPLSIPSILNLLFTFESFNFHHFILFTNFGVFLHFVQMIALTTILCCFATLSPTTTFVSTTSLILRFLTMI